MKDVLDEENAKAWADLQPALARNRAYALSHHAPNEATNLQHSDRLTKEYYKREIEKMVNPNLPQKERQRIIKQPSGKSLSKMNDDDVKNITQD